jgi:hypothetical protein
MIFIKQINYSIEKILHSFVHRSGILIDVRNQALKTKFEMVSDKSKLNANNFIDLIVKMTVGVPLKMIGKLKVDGTYPVAKVKEIKNSRVISVGVGNNMIFDEGMASLGASVWLYDHTVHPRIKKKFKSKLFFSPIGIRGEQKVLDCLTLSEILARSKNSISYNQTILKIDCEGAEWDVFLNTHIDILAEIDQINVELHHLDRIFELEYYKKYMKVLQKLNKKFVVTYIAVNNFTPTVKLNNGLKWPFTIEIHLLNKCLLHEFKPDHITPGIPNKLGFEKKNWHLAETENLSGWYKLA